MGYVFYNPNPLGKDTGDCVIRAISKALDYDWEKTYTELALQGYMMSDMPSSNAVWGTYLLNKGYHEYSMISKCKNCYTIADFCKDNPVGTYILGTGNHVVCCINGMVYDTFNSENMIPIYYFEKKENKNE